MSESLNVSSEPLDNRNVWMSYLISQGYPDIQKNLLQLHIANNQDDIDLRSRYEIIMDNMSSNRIGKAITSFTRGAHHSDVEKYELDAELKEAPDLLESAHDNPLSALKIADSIIAKDFIYLEGRERQPGASTNYSWRHPKMSVALHFGLVEPSNKKEELQSIVTSGFEEIIDEITMISRYGGDRYYAYTIRNLLALLHSYKNNFREFNDLVGPKINVAEAALENIPPRY